MFNKTRNLPVFRPSVNPKCMPLLIFLSFLSTLVVTAIWLGYRPNVGAVGIALAGSTPPSCEFQSSNSSNNCDLLTDRPPAIPNTVHYVFVHYDTAADLEFQFKHYLSLYAAWYYWRPETIFLHTNIDDAALQRARDGQTTRWSQLILRHPGLRINKVTMPTHAGNGRELNGLEHASDFLRVAAVADMGGTYIDFDVYALRDMKPLRESGFAGIVGRQAGDMNVNSGQFLGRPGCRMLKEWQRRMNDVYDGGWTTHSNDLLRDIAEPLIGQPGEAMIMEPKAFAPNGWGPEDIRALFGTHDDVPNHLRNVRWRDVDGVFLRPQLPPAAIDDQASGKRPGWQRDYSPTYMLHAFMPAKGRNLVDGLPALTPRYVLERQSDFARALYPVVEAMYERRILTLEDLEL